MGIFSALAAFLRAATVFMSVVYPAVERRKVTRQIEDYEDEIFRLADSGSPADKLQIERLAERKRRAVEQLSFIRSADGNAD